MDTREFKQYDKLWRHFAPLFVVFLVLDQLTKAWAVGVLEEGAGGEGAGVDFGFVLTYNDGVVFGIDLPEGLIYGLTLLILGLAAYLVIENRLFRDPFHLTALALLLAGAVGNLVDRIRLGVVIDFIKVYWWPTFNFADVFIVVAVVLFFWDFLFREETLSEI